MSLGNLCGGLRPDDRIAPEQVTPEAKTWECVLGQQPDLPVGVRWRPARRRRGLPVISPEPIGAVHDGGEEIAELRAALAAVHGKNLELRRKLGPRIA